MRRKLEQWRNIRAQIVGMCTSYLKACLPRNNLRSQPPLKSNTLQLLNPIPTQPRWTQSLIHKFSIFIPLILHPLSQLSIVFVMLAYVTMARFSNKLGKLDKLSLPCILTILGTAMTPSIPVEPDSIQGCNPFFGHFFFIPVGILTLSGDPNS